MTFGLLSSWRPLGVEYVAHVTVTPVTQGRRKATGLKDDLLMLALCSLARVRFAVGQFRSSMATVIACLARRKVPWVTSSVWFIRRWRCQRMYRRVMSRDYVAMPRTTCSSSSGWIARQLALGESSPVKAL